MTIYISNGEDAGSIRSRSGSAHYLWQEFQRQRQDAEALKMLSLKSSPLRLALVAVRNMLPPTSVGAAYFLNDGQEIKWRDHHLRSGDIIDFCQVTPASLLSRSNQIRLCKYIDTPLSGLLDYPEFAHIRGRVRDRVLAAERRSYAAAFRVFTYSEWCRREIVQQHHIAPEQVVVARSGANLPWSALAAAGSRKAVDGQLNLLFVGRDEERKGLAFLLEVAEQLRNRGLDVRLTVVGPDARVDAARPWVRHFGFLDKTRDLDKYVQLIGNCDFGVLWSSSEGLPNSLLECLAMGRAIISNDLPQIVDEFTGSASVILPRAARPDEVARLLFPLVSNPAQIQERLDQASKQRLSYTWAHAANIMLRELSKQ